MRKTRRSALAKQTLFGSGVTLWGERDFAVFKRFGKVHVSMVMRGIPQALRPRICSTSSIPYLLF
ncbi:MAG: hypothetical protein P4L49_03520 [Desulfosporosinus sp.]|nr:hypothetical protein [Desulfosporosinus sp.]